MITIAALSGGGGAAGYYLQKEAGCEHEQEQPGRDGVGYYVNGHDAPGQWLGRGATALGLTGALTTAQGGPVLRELLEGRFAGEQLVRPVWRYPDGPGGSRVDHRRSGFDATFSAPKSVSVLMALGSPQVQEQVRAAHRAAVGDAVGLLEQLAARAARGHQGDGQQAPRIATSGLIAAAFEHSTSRASDPQLHTHVVIANLTQGVDGRWSALDSRTLHREATSASYLYQHRLRAELTARLGVGWTGVDKGVAEIAGVPLHLRRLFSTRRVQIEQHLATHQPDNPKSRGRARTLAAKAACLITRPAKQHLAVTTLQDRWAGQATAVGFGPEALKKLLTQRHEPAAVDRAGLVRDVLSGDGVTRETATFTQGTVLRELCSQLPAGAQVSTAQLLTLASNLVATPDVVPVISEQGRAYTTVQMLLVEQHALALAGRTDTHLGATNPATAAAAIARSRLRPDQQRVAFALLTAGRPVEVVTGPAGSGKTAALRVATEQWQQHGRPVAGTAVAALSAQGLSRATGAPAVSLARLLHDPDRHLPTGGVLLLDEAGMVGTRQLHTLLELTQARECKLVLIGDPAQLPEMEAGGLFATLVAQPTALRLDGHGRQQDPWERDALGALRAGSTEQALDAYEQHGRLHTFPDRDALHEQVVTTYLQARAGSTDPWQTVVLASSREQVQTLNQQIRQRLRETGPLGSTALHVETPDGPVEYRTGEQVLINRNDHRRGLLNGTTAVVTQVSDHALTLSTTDGRTVTVDRGWLEQGLLSHGYAMTIHKAQGRTVHTALLVGDLSLSAEAGYVGLSRGTHANHLFLHTTDDPRGEPACQPTAAWRRPPAPERDRTSALTRSSQQHLASHQLRAEGRSR